MLALSVVTQKSVAKNNQGRPNAIYMAVALVGKNLVS